MIRTGGVIVLVPALLAATGSTLGFNAIIPELTMRVAAMPPEKATGLVRVETVLPDGRKIVRMVPVAAGSQHTAGVIIPSSSIRVGDVEIASVAPASLLAAKRAAVGTPLGVRGKARREVPVDAGEDPAEATSLATGTEAAGEVDSAAAEAAREAGSSRPTLVRGAIAPGERPTMVGSGWVPPRNTPRAPSGLDVVDAGNGGQARLSWVDNSTNETGFVILRAKLLNGVWSSLPNVVAAANTSEFTDTPGEGQIRYRVRAINNDGSSSYTRWDEVTVTGMMPAAPSGLQAVWTPTSNVSLTWNDLSTNELFFEIHREQFSGSVWGSPMSWTVGPDSRSSTDSPSAGSYRYRVRASNTHGSSTYTGWATAESSAAVPSEPTTLQVTSLGDGRSARATWVDTSSDESGFDVSRETLSGSSWVSPASVTLPANTTQYDDQPGAGTHRYQVRASNAAGSSAYTAWSEVTVTGLPPAAPSSFQVVASGDGASASWLDNANNETGYELAREQYVGTSWVSPATIALPANSAFHTDTPGQGTFRYRARAVNAAGGSSYTSWSSVVIQTGIPIAPSGAVASDIGNARAMVSWTDNSLNELGFHVERSPAFPLGLVSVGTGVTNYIDSSGPGSFNYRVRATNASGSSAWTGWASVSVMDTPPAAPTGLIASDAGNQLEVNLNWVDNASNETGFRIERETQAGSVWGNLTQLTAVADARSLLDNPGTGTHRYRVLATNTQGDSAWTGWATTTVSDGWTIFTPSADTRILYVSSSEGNDANDGLSEARAKRTVPAGYAQLRHGYPDWLMLKRGDVWDANFANWGKCGRSATEPIVVQSYGPNPGARPLLRTGTSHGFHQATGSQAPPSLDHVRISGIHFWAHTYIGTGDPVGVRFLGASEDNLFEDCMVEGFSGNVVLEGSNTVWVSNLRFRRCVLVDAYCNTSHSQGVYAWGSRNLLLEDCIIDHNGWKEGVAEPTIFNHNFYLSNKNENTVIRRCIIARASSHGVSMNMSGVIEDSLIVRNAISVFMRTQGSVVRGNVILEGRDTNAENQRGWAVEIGPRHPNNHAPSAPAVFENNIIANKTSLGSHQAIQISSNQQADATSITIRNNIIYNWRTQGIFVQNTGTALWDLVRIEGNTISEPYVSVLMIRHGPGTVDRNRFTYTGNRYNSSAPAGEWFTIGGGPRSLTQWRTDSGEGVTASIAGSFLEPSRTVGTYYRDRVSGGTDSLEAFLQAARQHSRFNGWGEHQPFTAPAVIAYIREGFTPQ